ncbi:MAG: hypothetical protein HY329_20890 [Chloroflexi bacterium]|nr:hypothetical protein [Chloroflexota bacterium]
MFELFTIDPDKLITIAQIVQSRRDIGSEELRAFLLANHRLDDDHQEWLDTASAAEIAEWVLEEY